ncbi:multicystatin-like isoform X1 [Humulus lupulus]|uniref:multicystatin-like isoform X1 n=1 Tax=Humulus lupulus TaxID=3486 RepID=UPI002B40AD72|nr:multicystatin-like isoform X1 [Humulus lupulus]XP_062102687.1 multicystatin-like isoform X1 [Humulus lupulus]
MDLGTNSKPMRYSREEFAKLQNPQYFYCNTYKNDPIYIESEMKNKLYMEQVMKWEGFHVDDFDIPFEHTEVLIVPSTNKSSGVKDAAKFAVEEYNKDKLEAIKLKRIVKWNYNQMIVKGMWYFMTLEATNGCFYEAKVYLSPWDDETLSNILEIFRLAKFYPMTTHDS